MKGMRFWVALLRVAHILAAKVTGQLLPFYDKSEAGVMCTAKVVLDGVAMEIVDAQGVFTLYEVQQGTHSLEIFALHQEFDLVWLEVRAETVVVRVSQNSRRFELDPDDVLELKSQSLVSPYETRVETSFLRLFLNPMSLMLAVAVFATYFAPKRMMDEEQMQELREMTKEMESKKGHDWVDSLLQMIDPED